MCMDVQGMFLVFLYPHLFNISYLAHIEQNMMKITMSVSMLKILRLLTKHCKLANKCQQILLILEAPVFRICSQTLLGCMIQTEYIK